MKRNPGTNLGKGFSSMALTALILSLAALALALAGCTQPSTGPGSTAVVPTQLGADGPAMPGLGGSAAVSDNQAKITLEELALHSAEGDCWVAYKGEVYDVTSWLPRHPGGVMAISMYCGTASEFEQAFEQKHGTSKVGLLKSEGLLEGVIA